MDVIEIARVGIGHASREYHLKLFWGLRAAARGRRRRERMTGARSVPRPRCERRPHGPHGVVRIIVNLVPPLRETARWTIVLPNVKLGDADNEIDAADCR